MTSVSDYVKKLWHDCHEANKDDNLPRVVWQRNFDTVITNNPGDVGLEPTGDVFAVHTGDPDYWCCVLARDYGRDHKEARLVYIWPKDGDFYCEDPQVVDKSGELYQDSHILLTDREVLERGVDFELDEDWRCECEEESDGYPG